MGDDLIEKITRRDLTFHVFFNYCNAESIAHLGEICENVLKSNEASSNLLAKILDTLKKGVPDENYEIIEKDLRAVIEAAKEHGPTSKLSQYVSGTPSWEGWTKEDNIKLKVAKKFVASHYSFLIIGILLGKEF